MATGDARGLRTIKAPREPRGNEVNAVVGGPWTPARALIFASACFRTSAVALTPARNEQSAPSGVADSQFEISLADRWEMGNRCHSPAPTFERNSRSPLTRGPPRRFKRPRRGRYACHAVFLELRLRTQPKQTVSAQIRGDPGVAIVSLDCWGTRRRRGFRFNSGYC